LAVADEADDAVKPFAALSPQDDHVGVVFDLMDAHDDVFCAPKGHFLTDLWFHGTTSFPGASRTAPGMWVIPVRAGGKKDGRQASGVTYEIVKVQVQTPMRVVLPRGAGR
jgi:hypothetical protein